MYVECIGIERLGQMRFPWSFKRAQTEKVWSGSLSCLLSFKMVKMPIAWRWSTMISFYKNLRITFKIPTTIGIASC